jgi:hypothetical protein
MAVFLDLPFAPRLPLRHSGDSSPGPSSRGSLANHLGNTGAL